MYTQKDFEKCMFNPKTPDAILEAYPQLKLIVDKDEEKTQYFEQIVRYVLALYDPNSPLIRAERDMNFRKEVAAEVAGFKPKDSFFVKGLLECKNEFVVKFIIRYLQRFVKDRVWAMIVSTEFTFWEYTRRLLNPDDTKADALKEIEIQEAAHTRLDLYYKTFFGDDIELQEAGKSVKMTAESVAKMGK